MGVASYDIVGAGKSWCILHDGKREGDYATREAAFESAVAAASLALREGHEVSVSVKGQLSTGHPLEVKPLSTLMSRNVE
jgi:hypothetical protein